MNQLNCSTEKRKGKQLCMWERKEIERSLACGASISSIARLLGRNKSTISREVKRGTVLQRKKKQYISSNPKDLGYTESKKYFSEVGERIGKENTGRRGGKYKLFNDPSLIRYIERKMLVDKWSPDAIVGYLKNNYHSFNTMVCTKTVYNNIDKGLLLVKNIDLLLKTRRKTKKNRTREHKRILGRSIDERPSIVEERQEFGHFEGDTIVGKNGKSAILTLTERKTSKGFMLEIKTRSALAVSKAIEKFNLQMPQGLIKSITFDNGSEFAFCSSFTDIDTFYAHPYSAYERGTNENYNGIIRRFIPKSKDLSVFSQAELNRINTFIDELPRKRLNYKTANQAFLDELENLSYPAG